MTYHYHEAATGANLHLAHEEVGLQRQFLRDKSRPLLTIAWNRGGTQTVWVDEIAYTLQTDDVILLIDSHSFRFAQPEAIVAWQFNRDFYCIIDHDVEVGCVGIIFYGIPSPMILSPSKELARKLDLLLQVFLDEFATHDNVQGEMLRMLLKRLIILLTRKAKAAAFKAAPEGDELDVVRKFNLLVEKNYQHLHQVQDYADLMNKSPKTLSNLFGKYSDKTPLQVIRERIALEAKRLLMFTDKPVSEVGYDLGFPESAHFSRFFKKMENQSPVQFREKLVSSREN